MQGMQQLWNLLILRLNLGFRFYEAEPSVCLHRPLPAIETVSGPYTRREQNEPDLKRAYRPIYCVKALGNRDAIACGLCLVSKTICRL